jgi:hypothetical protein
MYLPFTYTLPASLQAHALADMSRSSRTRCLTPIPRSRLRSRKNSRAVTAGGVASAITPALHVRTFAAITENGTHKILQPMRFTLRNPHINSRTTSLKGAHECVAEHFTQRNSDKDDLFSHQIRKKWLMQRLQGILVWDTSLWLRPHICLRTEETLTDLMALPS